MQLKNYKIEDITYGREHNLMIQLGNGHVISYLVGPNINIKYDMVNSLKFEFDNNFVCEVNKMISFYLNDNQYNKFMSALDKMKDLHLSGKYKYISLLHDCESVASNTFYYSNFTEHYSNFLTKSELLNAQLVDAVILKNQYYIDPQTLYISHREFLNKILHKTLGKDFRDHIENVKYYKNLTLISKDRKQYNLNDLGYNKEEMLKLKDILNDGYDKAIDILAQRINLKENWLDTTESKRKMSNLVRRRS